METIRHFTGESRGLASHYGASFHVSDIGLEKTLCLLVDALEYGRQKAGIDLPKGQF